MVAKSSLAAKAKGAQPGNLNGSRHPWRAFWRRRCLRPADQWVLPLVANYEAGIEEDRGRELSFAETRVVDLAKTARVCQLLALGAFADNGIMLESVTLTNSPVRGQSETRKGDVLHPAFKELSRFMKVELDALRHLGLKAAKREPLSLTDYVQQRYPKGTTRKE